MTHEPTPASSTSKKRSSFFSAGSPHLPSPLQSARRRVSEALKGRRRRGSAPQSSVGAPPSSSSNPTASQSTGVASSDALLLSRRRSSLQSPPQRDLHATTEVVAAEDDYYYPAVVHNIDEAMRSLYATDSKPTLWTSLSNNNSNRSILSPSYVPTETYDWVLDGRRGDDDSTAAVQDSQMWLEELERGGSRRMKQAEAYVQKWQAQHENVEGEMGNIDDVSHEDEDDFGDFQSACVIEIDTPNPETQKQQPATEASALASVASPKLVHPIESSDSGNDKKNDSLQASPTSSSVVDQGEDSGDTHVGSSDERSNRDDSSPRASSPPSSSSSLELDVENTVSSSVPPPQTVSLPSSSTAGGISDSTNVFAALSLRLPLNDSLGSPEGRFTRRRQQFFQHEQQQTTPLGLALDSDDIDKGLLDDLPAYYFTNPDLDDTAKLLQSLPWHYVGIVQDDGRDDDDWAPMWDESMTTRLCKLDGALEAVQSQLLTAVQPHQDDHLNCANELVHECEQNIRLAQIYWQRSHESLQRAALVDGTIHGPTLLVQTWNQRDAYRQLQQVLDVLAGVESRVQELAAQIDALSLDGNLSHEYLQATTRAEELRQSLCGSSLAQIHCLDDQRVWLQDIASRFWNRLWLLCKSMAVQWCRRRQPCWNLYHELVQVCTDLYAKYPDSIPDFASCWTERLLGAFCYEADRSFAVALIDPVSSGAVVPDDYAREVDKLAYEVDLDWGDSAKLRTLTHNLVTIRFDFEASTQNYLPAVFQKLCELLTEILNAHFQHIQWHRSQSEPKARTVPGDPRTDNVGPFSSTATRSEQCNCILPSLLESRNQLWQHCEGVATRCLDEYLNFSAQSSLFNKTADEGAAVDDGRWSKDLDGLREVFVILDRFSLLKASFFGDDASSGSGSAVETALSEKLGDVCRRHLRCVHVEAMNTLGRRLANETWILKVFDEAAVPRNEGPDANKSMRTFLREVLRSSLGPRRRRGKWWGSLEHLGSEFERFDEDDNPFGSKGAHSLFDSANQEATAYPHFDDTLESSVMYDSVASMFGDVDSSSRLAPGCVTSDVLQWFVRLLRIMLDLPLIAEDVSAVFANLCDLYVTTVLRICSGTSVNERYLLGIAQPEPYCTEVDDNPISRPAMSSSMHGSPLFDPFRKGGKISRSRAPQRTLSVSSSLDAEICSPRPLESESIVDLRKFVLRAQDSLKDVVTLDMVNTWIADPEADTVEEEACQIARVLEQRSSAAQSLWVVAGLADATFALAVMNLAASSGHGNFSDNLLPLRGYVCALLRVTPTLASVANQISSQRAVGSVPIVSEILGNGPGWGESKLNEEPNEYVESLCQKCALIWAYLSASAKLPTTTMSATYGSLLTAAYLCLLEGFARIPFCSTEGRALMTLDLASFAAGVGPRAIADKLGHGSLVAAPAQMNLERGRAYVDKYVKAFYLPFDDAMAWIRSNYKEYKLNHALALVAGTANGPVCPEVARLEVTQLYGTETCLEEQA